MHYFRRVLVPVGTTIAIITALPGLAEPGLDITIDTAAFDHRELTADGIKVSVSYQPPDYEALSEANLQYQIYHNEELYIDTAETTFGHGSVNLQDLDSSGTPEVIVTTYTGGAHCCTIYSIYSWQDNEFAKTQTVPLDGGGGQFKDLDGEGNVEFITRDQAFFYAFSSYAGSFPPSLILTFDQGQFDDTTPQFESQLRSTAWQMYQAIVQGKQEGLNINGMLAGYVAQKILLGEYEQAWDFMQVHYDRTSDWGLEIYSDTGEVMGRYPDFPTALQAFLIQLGYLDANGQPHQSLDRSARVIAESQATAELDEPSFVNLQAEPALALDEQVLQDVAQPEPSASEIKQSQ